MGEPRILKLDGAGVDRLRTALLAAFPSRAALAEMVLVRLDENLEAIAAMGHLRSTLLELIEWATAEGKLDALITGACAASPGNLLLRAFAEDLGLPIAPADTSGTREAPADAAGTPPLPLPLAPAPSPPPRGATRPHPRVRDVFVGREAELAALAAAVLPSSEAPGPPAIAALQGMAGVGKSYLADRFALEHAASFPGGYHKLSLEPADARDAEALGAALASRHGQSGWGGERGWDELRGRLRSPRALLHVENADGRDAAEAVGELVGRLDGCAIVVSGRYQGLGESAGWKRVEVATLPGDQAIAQLAVELKKSVARADLERLAAGLGWLPLALHLAAGYLNAGQTVDQFLRRLDEAGLALRPRDPADPLNADKVRAIVSSTFELSLRLLRDALGDRAEAAMPAFAALGDAPASGVGRSLGAAIAGIEETAFEDLMFDAVELSLAERVPESKREDGAWRVHPLLAALLRKKGDARGMRGMTAWFVARLPEGEDQGRRWNEILQEGEALVGWLGRVPLEEMARVEEAGYWFAVLTGPFPAWTGFCERLLRSREDPAGRSSTLWTLSQVASKAGDLTRACEAAKEKAEIDRARGDARGGAQAASVLAGTAAALGKLDEALDIHREQLWAYAQLGDAREYAVTLTQIANVEQARGDLDEALRIYRDQALPIYERFGDARLRAVTLGKIADILQARGELDEALRIRQEEELPVYERLGDARERTLALGKIADVKEARGELDEALRLRREEVLPVLERLGDARELFVARANLACTLLLRAHPGDRAEASALITLALGAVEGMRLPEAADLRYFQQREGL